MTSESDALALTWLTPSSARTAFSIRCSQLLHDMPSTMIRAVARFPATVSPPDECLNEIEHSRQM
jgi:hypothetical protein